MSGYGQFCPVAKAMELLDERWTMLVVRELLAGSRHFNELRRGVPRMSPTLLSKRLRTLERAGLVTRDDSGNRVRYELSPAGHELAPVVGALAAWGMRWMPRLGDEDLDPHLLMWDVHRNIDLAAVPPGRTVVAFHFTDVEPPARTWWVVIDDPDVDLCAVDPGFDVQVQVWATLQAMTLVWRGDLSWAEALRTGRLRLDGCRSAQRALPRWLKLSAFASVPRARPPRAPGGPSPGQGPGGGA